MRSSGGARRNCEGRMTQAETEKWSTVVVVGLGNIGSQVVELVGRLSLTRRNEDSGSPLLRRVVLIDCDTYSETNLPSQRILRRDVGRPKAFVQARRLHAINPALEVLPLVDDIAKVPVGWLRGAIVLAGLDSLQARIALNESAWRAGAPWIDGGVETALELARVTMHLPTANAACFECGLEPADYEAIATRHLCAVSSEAPAPTNGSAVLGALTAALMGIELEALLAGRALPHLGHELVMDAAHHTQFVTPRARNPACRFHHQQWPIEILAGVTERSSLREALAAAQRAWGGDRAVSLSLPGQSFARALRCPLGCETRNLFALSYRLRPVARICSQCGRVMFAAGFDQVEHLTASALNARLLRRSLRALGLRAGDVLVASDGERQAQFEISQAAMT